MGKTDITSQSGKGPQLWRNVSTKAYRAGWEQIFERRKKKVDNSGKNLIGFTEHERTSSDKVD